MEHICFSQLQKRSFRRIGFVAPINLVDSLSVAILSFKQKKDKTNRVLLYYVNPNSIPYIYNFHTLACSINKR